MKSYYHDWFCCPCGEQYIIKVPVLWARDHMEEFQTILNKQEKVQEAHYLCHFLYEIKSFLKQPVVIQMGGSDGQ